MCANDGRDMHSTIENAYSDTSCPKRWRYISLATAYSNMNYIFCANKLPKVMVNEANQVFIRMRVREEREVRKEEV